MQNPGDFVFQTEHRLVMLTGKKASSLPELVGLLRQVSGSSVFYHTHHQYLAHHFEKAVFHNDFALWASVALLEEPLAEKLASIDLLAFGSIRELRECIIAKVESYMTEVGRATRECLPGDEFHFCESKSFIMPSGVVARDIPEFFASFRRVSNSSLFFHYFEARLRLRQKTNDFSSWLRYRGADSVAEAIERLNPYLMTLEELREEIIRLGESRG